MIWIALIVGSLICAILIVYGPDIIKEREREEERRRGEEEYAKKIAYYRNHPVLKAAVDAFGIPSHVAIKDTAEKMRAQFPYTIAVVTDISIFLYKQNNTFSPGKVINYSDLGYDRLGTWQDSIFAHALAKELSEKLQGSGVGAYVSHLHEDDRDVTVFLDFSSFLPPPKKLKPF